MQLADNIAVIANGKLKSLGTKDEIFPNLMKELSADCGFRGGK